jgi:hypothetical protein
VVPFPSKKRTFSEMFKSQGAPSVLPAARDQEPKTFKHLRRNPSTENIKASQSSALESDLSHLQLSNNTEVQSEEESF